MSKLNVILGILLLATVARAELPNDYVAVANRSASSISIFSTESLSSVEKITASDVGSSFEPMYVSYLKGLHAFAVGDRKGNRVLLFDEASAKFLGSSTTSKGVFHQWADPSGKTLYVVGDMDRTVDILKFRRGTRGLSINRTVFQIPSAYRSGVPHDVIADENFFYVTIKGGAPANGDYVLKVDAKTCRIEGKLAFTNEVHLGLPLNSDQLFVVEQARGRVNSIDRRSFTIASTLDGISGAHGLIWSETEPRLFVSNFMSDGHQALFDISARSPGLKLSSVQDTLGKMPHNLALDEKAGLLFATHSGADNKGLSVYAVGSGDSDEAGLLPVRVLETDANPFGLAVVHR